VFMGGTICVVSEPRGIQAVSIKPDVNAILPATPALRMLALGTCDNLHELRDNIAQHALR
jgi:hypothetical protein